MESDPISLKLVMVGDGAVGKTCLLQTYVSNEFPRQYAPTIFDNKTTTIKLDNEIIHLGLWDTAGQEEYARLRPLAYNNADIFMVTFSVVDPNSFSNVLKKWVKEVKSVQPRSVVLIVGNKIDLRDQAFDKSEFISTQRGLQGAEELSCQYSECSALTREGLKETFDKAVRLALKSVNREAKVSQKSEECCPSCLLI